MRRTLIALALAATATSVAQAQSTRPAAIEAQASTARPNTGVLRDPAVIDEAHYKVEFEDESMRILRVHFEPGESSPMHEHPRAVCIIALTEERTKHTMPDGTSAETEHQPGDVACTALEPGWYRHSPKNVGTTAEDYLIIERKVPHYGRGLQPVKPRTAP